MWSDWVEDDPVLGPNNWATFLTEELPPLLATGIPGRADGLAHNGSWGVMGLSMGASAAVHLANTYDMFDAVAGGIAPQLMAAAIILLTVIRLFRQQSDTVAATI